MLHAMSRTLLLVGALVLVACKPQPAPTQEELRASALNRTRERQIMLDEASIVCRDGWAYLAGDDHIDAGNGGPFVTPYMRNSVQGRCIGNTAAWSTTGKE